jgi:hypothetical protein
MMEYSVNNRGETRNEVAVAYFKISSWKLLLGTTKDHKNVRTSLPMTEALRKEGLV